MNLRSIEPKFFKTSNQLIQGRMLDNGRENAFPGNDCHALDEAITD
jgi:hypothetical protein